MSQKQITEKSPPFYANSRGLSTPDVEYGEENSVRCLLPRTSTTEPQNSLSESSYTSLKVNSVSLLLWLTTASRLPVLAVVSGRRIFWQTVNRRLAETGIYARCSIWCVPLTASSRKDQLLWSWASQEWGYVLFSNDSKCTRQRDSRRVFPWRENEARFHPSFVTKIKRFGIKGILMCGGMLLSSPIPRWYYSVVFDALRYRNQILKDSVSFYWMLWAHTTFLWTIMCGHTELTMLMNFTKERIFAI
ncbi:transposable element Tcb2 transposase [Trichonephila clavipes]|uniref:Transposable element Tcb2 transposase n=1 Tax=Trichonephila clavipes TaxID=2585209 RepID=A0A8X6V576_TRICX|nr:transposable element Tcb2 transposase [Trichonephila clavipes]